MTIKTLIFLIIAYLLITKVCEAKQMAFHCDLNGSNIIFATTVSDDAKDIRRVYNYDNNITYFIFIPDLNASQLTASIVIEETGHKAYGIKSSCTAASN